MSVVEDLVIRSVRALAETDGIEALARAEGDTVLFGKDGNLDSAGLIFLITEIEEAVSRDLGVEITLVDEKAFARRSPFRTVSALASYLQERVDEAR